MPLKNLNWLHLGILTDPVKLARIPATKWEFFRNKTIGAAVELDGFENSELLVVKL